MNSGDLEGDGFFGRHLLYIPDGPTDPNVVFDPDFDQEAFFAWAAGQGLGPGFTERNGYNTGWSNRFDLRISQEIPLPANLVGRIYFKVYNLGNLLNDDWGEIVDAQFFTPEIVDASVDDQGRFVFESSRIVRSSALTSTAACGKPVSASTSSSACKRALQARRERRPPGRLFLSPE